MLRMEEVELTNMCMICDGQGTATRHKQTNDPER